MTGGPLTFPLAGLLAEVAGTRREEHVSDIRITLPDDLELAAPIEGDVRITRTNRGLLVEAELTTAIHGTCSRCLDPAVVPLEVRIETEVLPSIDLATGQPVDASAEPDVPRLTAHHELALEPEVADAISLAEPIVVLCRPDCPGLCPECGERLGPGHVAHEDGEVDPRLAVLRGFGQGTRGQPPD